METLLEVNNICKSFVGVRALKDVSLQVKSGEIHCLAGENGCGKSTLIKCISGVYVPEAGEMVLHGRSYSSLTPQRAMKEGVQVIYQDLSLFQHMSIAENIAIGRLRAEKRKFVSQKEVWRIAKEQMERIGVCMDLSMTAGETSVANRQLTAICRALAQEARILFMDEPTTALTKREVSRLLKVILELKQKGLAVVFISHKLDEVFSVADVITILRGGEKIGDFKSDELNEKKLSYYMTGREVEYPRYHRKCTEESPVLEVCRLSRKHQFDNISMTVRPGDIVGLTGLLGSGRTELAMSLFGLNQAQSGCVKMDGKEIAINSPMDAKKAGIALLPEDRFTQGLFMDRQVRENISSALINEISPHHVLNRKAEIEVAQKYVRELKVRTPSVETVAGTLSGGNQQKVVIGKWSATRPRVFIMDTPTVGIDIGSKAEIYEQIHKFADAGMAVIFISDEIQEILANCNRLYILAEGECAGVLEEDDLQQGNVERQIADMMNAAAAYSGEEASA